MLRCLIVLCASLLAAVVLALPSGDVPIDLAVVDLAGVTSTEERNTLESQLRQINRHGDMQAAVVIVPSTDGVDLFDYGMALADRWQLGDAEKDNGLLLVVAVNDRKLRFFQGYGLEGDLPDIALKKVISDTITPYFKQGNYAQGIAAGMDRIAKALNGEGLPLPSGSEGDDSTFDIGVLPFVIALAFMWARGLAKRFGKLLTWLGLSGVGCGLIVITLGATMQALLFAVLFSVAMLVVTLFAAAMPVTAGSGSGRVVSTGSMNRHSRRSSSSGGWSSYRGGGGGFGGGGAGGSW